LIHINDLGARSARIPLKKLDSEGGDAGFRNPEAGSEI
jgi:hypothetical protein